MAGADTFFTVADDHYVPTTLSRGFWAEDSVAGPMLAGLIAHEVERKHGAAGWVPARLTIDMVRRPRHRPIRIDSREIHRSGRLRLIEADFVTEDGAMARARCQLLRRTQQPPGCLNQTAGWTEAYPRDTPPSAQDLEPRERLSAVGGVHSAWPRRIWIREFHDILPGVASSPFVRAAICADLASSLANSAVGPLGFINSDVTLYLHRQPVGDWLGLEAAYHRSEQGIAHGLCWLHDRRGAVGSAAVAAVSQVRGTD